ncbi:MAG: glucosamine-6-phosphate isomerase [Anaerolineae bacterium]
MDRQSEVRALLRLTPDEVRAQAGAHLVVLPDIDALHRQMAQDIADEITAHQSGEPLRLILPVGPVGQYGFLAAEIAARQLSLANCWLFFMDEYCDSSGHVLDAAHPLSFKGAAQQLFLSHLPAECGLRSEQVIFPDEHNISHLSQMIADLGGIHTCYGGIGIHGHVAFNEPEPGVAGMGARKVRLNDFTVTINAIRAEVGGNLENFPREAYTLGMTDILGARRIRLYCRNGIALDWANTVLRLALLGAPGDDYPVTHIRQHADYVITTDETTLASPKNHL